MLVSHAQLFTQQDVQFLRKDFKYHYRNLSRMDYGAAHLVLTFMALGSFLWMPMVFYTFVFRMEHLAHGKRFNSSSSLFSTNLAILFYFLCLTSALVDALYNLGWLNRFRGLVYGLDLAACSCSYSISWRALRNWTSYSSIAI